MTQQGSYSMQQKTFAFSLVSNAAATVTSGFAQAITDKFNALTSGYAQYVGTGWSIVWGPSVYTATGSTVADNALIVVQGSDANGNPVYIVATAGTNPQSKFDELTEDLKVGQMVTFNGAASVSQGTSIGLGILEGLGSNGKTVQQFLTSVASTKATLIFTGHSLGGALSPALALDLFVNKGMQLGQWGAVYVMPTAGPTPGNQAFANLFRNTFKATSGWNQNVINSLDVVPMAWNNLLAIAGVYNPPLAPSACVQKIVGLLVADRGIQFYAALPQAPFAGTYNNNPPLPPQYASDPTCQFAAQALYQHIAAYTLQLVHELQDLFPGLALSEAECADLQACKLSAAA